MQKKILIVDDEPMIREIFKEAFEAVGFIAHDAQNGRAAFQSIMNESYDCVLSDVRMPGGDGVELAKNIFHMSGPKPQVFLVTGFSDVNTQKAIEWGVQKIFDKPFSFKDVIEGICASVQQPHVHSPG
ncbi:MAG: response regulator [Bdellovibrionales bacterium]|nr:response regulator [Bdellovibrionales bacterium]